MGRWATVEPDGPDGCALTMSTDTLDWPMMVLANIDAEFVVEEPSELAALLPGPGSGSPAPPPHPETPPSSAPVATDASVMPPNRQPAPVVSLR